jgi:hypothetical protein
MEYLPRDRHVYQYHVHMWRTTGDVQHWRKAQNYYCAGYAEVAP